ncbi:hypothetical protein [Actinomadura macrotermitis]|uniref:Uncharacterized protein n=1 Tax=Actinomadura macrotermitis TaxID=2585200 RepID=A0A7K0BLF2_9ACTN|nr:hypothetical protein [Actinomadura macrotermitis]MQY02013.1 hypothetical protein [Actinomadura macrotermitis]
MSEAYGARQFAAHLGITAWQLRLARENEMLPPPDVAPGRWSRELAGRCAGEAEKIIAEFGPRPPVGAEKAAARLAERVGLDVDKPDIEVLVARDDLTMAGRYQGNPIYLLRDLDALAPETVTEVVAARKGPLMESVSAHGAARALGWPKPLFDRIAAERALATDRLGRYALGDIRALAADTGLMERIGVERHRAVVRKARDREERCAEALRAWLAGCTAYVEQNSGEPPDIAVGRRALRALAAARAEVELCSTEPRADR